MSQQQLFEDWVENLALVNAIAYYGCMAEYRKKPRCVWGHKFTEKTTYIRPNGHRDCKVCRARREKEYVKKLKGVAA